MQRPAKKHSLNGARLIKTDLLPRTNSLRDNLKTKENQNPFEEIWDANKLDPNEVKLGKNQINSTPEKEQISDRSSNKTQPKQGKVREFFLNLDFDINPDILDEPTLIKKSVDRSKTFFGGKVDKRILTVKPN